MDKNANQQRNISCTHATKIHLAYSQIVVVRLRKLVSTSSETNSR
jgi:hypothetical protein